MIYAMLRRPLKTIPPLGPPKLSPQQRVLAQWRGLDLSAAEKSLRSSARAAADLMPQVLSDLRIDRRLSEADDGWNIERTRSHAELMAAAVLLGADAHARP